MSKAAIRFNLKHLLPKNKIENYNLKLVCRDIVYESSASWLCPLYQDEEKKGCRFVILSISFYSGKSKGAELTIGLKVFKSDYRSLDFL